MKSHGIYFFCLGYHDCEICLDLGKKHSDLRNVFIPAKNGVVYLAPGMIVHYIREHDYLPPDDFINAVLNAPEQGSEDFLSMLKKIIDWYENL